MAAVLVRRGARLCCFHRELCRVVWRPQAALFSSNQSDRKQPRRTHIRKAKPQPAVDVSTLLEQIFSHRRPGTLPPASKYPVSGIAATGSASVDKKATVTDGVPDPPALGEIEPELEEGKEEVVQTEALEVQKDLDPVQRLFLEKIKEYNMHSGGAAVKEPDYERRLSEETAKLQRLYGGGDLNSFPQFTFTEPKMDQDTK